MGKHISLTTLHVVIRLQLETLQAFHMPTPTYQWVHSPTGTLSSADDAAYTMERWERPSGEPVTSEIEPNTSRSQSNLTLYRKSTHTFKRPNALSPAESAS